MEEASCEIGGVGGRTRIESRKKELGCAGGREELAAVGRKGGRRIQRYRNFGARTYSYANAGWPDGGVIEHMQSGTWKSK